MTRLSTHPDQEALRAFMAGDLARPEAREVVLHLLADCAHCRQTTAELSPFGVAAEAQPATIEASARELVDLLRDRSVARETAQSDAEGLGEELVRLPHAHRLLFVRNNERFGSWSLAEWLLERSYGSRFDDAGHALDLADLAICVLDRVEPLERSEALLADLRARAWALKGNAARIGSDHREAESCLAKAVELLAEGTGDPLEEARILGFLSALRSDQGRVEEAIRFQKRVFSLYRRAGDPGKMAKSLIDQASYLAATGERAQAISLLRAALEELQGGPDSRLVLAATHNLAVLLQEDGRTHEALALVAEATRLQRSLGDRLTELRLLWLQGRLAREVGDAAMAEAALRRTAQGFVDAEVPLDAALAALELTDLYLEAGRTTEVFDLALRIEKVFRDLDVRREALATWLFVLEALRRQTLSVELLRQATTLLEKQSNA